MAAAGVPPAVPVSAARAAHSKPTDFENASVPHLVMFEIISFSKLWTIRDFRNSGRLEFSKLWPLRKFRKRGRLEKYVGQNTYDGADCQQRTEFQKQTLF